jgi:DNA mismatch repair ATPase MutS
MMHSFYSCKKHDATQLDQVFEINLYDLAEQKHISMNYNPLYEVDIYCKKVFDYSLERIYE